MKEATHCSFCGKHRDEVARLVSGPAEVGLCNECHDLMRELMPEPQPLSAEELAERKADIDRWLAAGGTL